MEQPTEAPGLGAIPEARWRSCEAAQDGDHGAMKMEPYHITYMNCM